LAGHVRSGFITDGDAEILYSPTDMPYGYREYSARELEGGLWSFMKPMD